MRKFAYAAVVVILSAGCQSLPPIPEGIIRAAVEATINALPTATLPAEPSPPPTPRPAPLSGIFCEYNFCIGHPIGMAFFDVVAKQNPNSPVVSTYESGRLATHDPSTFIELIWLAEASTADLEYFLDQVIDDGVDVRSGSTEALFLTATNVTYVPISTNATELLPYGGAAAWACGRRGFAWKAYSSQPLVPRQLLGEALSVFRCEE